MRGIKWVKTCKKFFNDLKTNPELRRKIREEDGNWDNQFLDMPHGNCAISEGRYPQFSDLNELLDCIVGFNGEEMSNEIINSWMNAFEDSEQLEKTN